ncbi:MAG: hypothetical protein KKF54_05165 [Candidatus Omnitrophica bacterium]|nr:hypothetical protein [Candidatus Omnitrophota bacterium]
MNKNNHFEIRFGVKNKTGLFSRTWKLWHSNNEIYFLERNCGDRLKVSLHKSGNYHIKCSQGNIIEKWICPKNNLKSDFTLVLRIMIPSSELRTYEPKKNREKTHWIDASPNGYAKEIGVILEHTLQHMMIGWPGSNNDFVLLGQSVLSNGEKLWLIYRDIKLSDNDIDLLRVKKENGKNEGGAFLIGKELDGSRKIMEVALN